MSAGSFLVLVVAAAGTVSTAVAPASPSAPPICEANSWASAAQNLADELEKPRGQRPAALRRGLADAGFTPGAHDIARSELASPAGPESFPSGYVDRTARQQVLEAELDEALAADGSPRARRLATALADSRSPGGGSDAPAARAEPWERQARELAAAVAGNEDPRARRLGEALAEAGFPAPAAWERIADELAIDVADSRDPRARRVAAALAAAGFPPPTESSPSASSSDRPDETPSSAGSPDDIPVLDGQDCEMPEGKESSTVDDGDPPIDTDTVDTDTADSVIPKGAREVFATSFDEGFAEFDNCQNVAMNSDCEDVSQAGGSLELVSDGLDGENAARFEVAPGDVPGFGGGERSEVAAFGEALTRDGDERWYDFAIKFDEDFPTPPEDGWCVVMQWHSGDGSPPLAIEVSSSDELLVGGEGGDPRVIGPIRRGEWVNYTLRAGFSNDPSEGFVAAWENGKQTVRRTSRATMSSEENYLKLGIYRDTDDETAGLLYDDLRVFAAGGRPGADDERTQGTPRGGRDEGPPGRAGSAVGADPDEVGPVGGRGGGAGSGGEYGGQR